ncbi:unnamed protein product [Cochlearia groenlandica]
MEKEPRWGNWEKKMREVFRRDIEAGRERQREVIRRAKESKREKQKKEKMGEVIEMESKKFNSPGGEVSHKIESNLSEALAKIDFEVLDPEKVDFNLCTLYHIYYDAVPKDLLCPWLDMFNLPTCFNLKLPDIIHVGEFFVYAIIARSRPDLLIETLPLLRENSYLKDAPNLIPVTVWTIAQTFRHNLSVALYSWARNLLPLFSSCNNGSSQDLILALVEKILSEPDAKNKLCEAAAPIYNEEPKSSDPCPYNSIRIFDANRNAAASLYNEEHVIPPCSFEILLRLTFPDTSARVDATGRFEVIYPVLKEVALANVLSSNQWILELFGSCLRLSEQGNPALAEEAESIAMWCLTENLDCWKHWKWDSLYKENFKASAALHRKFLLEEWMPYSLGQSSLRLNTLVGQPGSPEMRSLTHKIFEFSFGLARDGNRDLHTLATAMGIWSLNLIFDCCKLYDDLHGLNLIDIVNFLFEELVGSAQRGGRHHHPLNEASREIFLLSLKLAKEEVIGNHVVAEQVKSIALWCLSLNDDCFSVSLI